MITEQGQEKQQPDLSLIACDMINRIMANMQLPESERLVTPITPENVTVRCQRVWPLVRSVNPRLNGADFSAGVVQIEQDGRLFSYFIEAIKIPGATGWHEVGSSGGKIPAERRNRAGGFMLGGGSHVCVGGIGVVPDGGMIRVEMANGDVFESRGEDGCCIVFAPVSSPPHPDDHVTVRYIGSDGEEFAADTVFIGNDKPPPSARPASV